MPIYDYKKCELYPLSKFIYYMFHLYNQFLLIYYFNTNKILLEYLFVNVKSGNYILFFFFLIICTSKIQLTIFRGTLNFHYI